MPKTHSIVMRSKTGTIRHINGEHNFDIKQLESLNKVFNGFYWQSAYNENLNDDLTFEVAQKNNISINLSKTIF